MKLGVAFGWHVHPWETLLSLVQRAEELGYAAAFVDGDISMLDGGRRFDVLNGWTLTTTLLAHTERIEIGSLRLVHHWNAAQLAQSVATVERIHPGRLRFFISIGDRPHDGRFGLKRLDPRERVMWLDETLTAVRGLWSGDAVTMRGSHVELESATVQPTPPRGRISIAIAARRAAMLDQVAAHGDVWDVNLPPIKSRVEAAAQQLRRSCRQRGRNPDEISRSMWIFTRLAGQNWDREAALAEFRRLNPWFQWIPDSEIDESLVFGSEQTCRAKIAAHADSLGLELPVIDLSGLDARETQRILTAMAPENDVDAGT